MRHLDADLVRAPGEQMALHQAQRPLGAQQLIVGDRGLGARLGAVLDIDLVLLRVLEQVVLQPPLRGLRAPVYGAEIVFLDLAVADLVVEDAQRLGVFRSDDDAAGVAVDAVAERGGEGILLPRAPLALLCEIGLDVRDQRVVVPDPGAVAEHARLLVGQEQVLILIDDADPRGADLEIGILLPGLFKEFVVDV